MYVLVRDMCVYLVKFVWYHRLHIAARHINLSPIIVEIDASHPVQNGPHHTSLSSILALLKKKEGEKISQAGNF